MRNIILTSLLFGSLVFSEKVSCVVTYTSFDDTDTSFETKGCITVDNSKRFCQCGNDPVALFMVYGYIQCYCYQHLNEMIVQCSKIGVEKCEDGISK